MSEPSNRRGRPVRDPDRRHVAGVLDIRNIIGGLLGVYGIILTLMGVFADPETDKTGGVNANLWTGICLLIGAAGFVTWARLRPILVPETKASPDADDDGPEEVPQ